ncbi:alpha/beta hydrolase fold domain-containing protein [Nonomuraea sp. NPDC049480]|uniref:alpha/beta hydrolase fold domain-containing protein n=1 Tax=Nonomuraea sp. NPDC049480 TaxID=3364353 RepID=UPI0037B56F68
MAWFWDAYTTHPAQRAEIIASPWRATLDDLAGLPPAIVVGKTNVPRDEGEACTRRLTKACVPTTSVRCNGTLHDFMMLDPAGATHAVRAAVAQAIAVLDNAVNLGKDNS